MGILEQHGVKFVTFQLQGDAKYWWRVYVELVLPPHAPKLPHSQPHHADPGVGEVPQILVGLD